MITMLLSLMGMLLPAVGDRERHSVAFWTVSRPGLYVLLSTMDVF